MMSNGFLYRHKGEGRLLDLPRFTFNSDGRQIDFFRRSTTLKTPNSFNYSKEKFSFSKVSFADQ